MSKKLGKAWKTILEHCSEDYDYAWALFCNLAVPIADYSDIGHVKSNEAAAHVMKHIFGYDVTGLQRYQDIVEPEAKDGEPEGPQPPNAGIDIIIRELTKGNCCCKTTRPAEEVIVKTTTAPKLGNVSEGIRILAVNPVNGKMYTEKDSVIFSAKDKGLIVLLEKYYAVCKRIGVNLEHLQSIELLKQRVTLYQERLASNIVEPKFVIDRKFKIVAVTRDGIYDEYNSVLFCAKDRGFSHALTAYYDFYNGSHLQERADMIYDLTRRVHMYQIQVESKIPDTIGGEIDRCINWNVGN